MSDFPKPPFVQAKEEERETERQVPEDDEHRNSKTQNRICDFCGDSTALLYCRADSAKLCLSCDREVHSTNQLFTKHTRWRLCDACDSSPSSILCSTHNSVLCQNCDWEIHNRSVSSLHDRRPLEGFTGCPSVTELLAIVGFENADYKALFGCDRFVGGGVYGSTDVSDGFSDSFAWEAPLIVNLDDLIVSTNSGHNFKAIGVPPPPKCHNAALGQYKEEMIHQLRELAKLEPDFSDGHGAIEPLVGFKSQVPEEDQQPANTYLGSENDFYQATIPYYEESAFPWSSDNPELTNQGLHNALLGSYPEENCLVPDEDLDIGGSVSRTIGDHGEQSHDHMGTEILQVHPKVAVRELTSQERDSAITRYKEKKKTRRYDKHVRYESRKVRAETRTRIKGRFAKLDH